MAHSDVFNNMMAQVNRWWQQCNVKGWVQDVAGSSSEMVDISLAFALSFSIGFFFKRYFRILFLLALTVFFAAKVGEYNGFVTIHWNAMYHAIGYGNEANIQALVQYVIAWIKLNFALFASGMIGFVIGSKLG